MRKLDYLNNIEYIKDEVKHLIKLIKDIYAVEDEYRIIINSKTLEKIIEYNYVGICKKIIKHLRRNVIYSIDYIVYIAFKYLYLHTKYEVDMDEWKKTFIYEAYIASLEIEEYNYIDDLFLGYYYEIQDLNSIYKFETIKIITEAIKEEEEVVDFSKEGFFIGFIKIIDNFLNYPIDDLCRSAKTQPAFKTNIDNNSEIYSILKEKDNEYLDYLLFVGKEYKGWIINEDDDEDDDDEDDDLEVVDNE